MHCAPDPRRSLDGASVGDDDVIPASRKLVSVKSKQTSSYSCCRGG